MLYPLERLFNIQLWVEKNERNAAIAANAESSSRSRVKMDFFIDFSSHHNDDDVQHYNTRGMKSLSLCFYFGELLRVVILIVFFYLMVCVP